MAALPILRVGTLVLGKGPGSTLALGQWARAGGAYAGDVDIPLMRMGDSRANTFDWSKMVAQSKMGQSRNMLLGTRESSSSFTVVSDFLRKDAGHAQSALEISQGMDINAHISSIKKVGKNEILVMAINGVGEVIQLLAGRVICAFGSGAERAVDVPIDRRNSGLERPFKEHMVGSQGLAEETSMHGMSTTLIFGDGPTAIWNAERCLRNGTIPFVVGPNSDLAFANANPGGRNSATMDRLRENGLLLTANAEGIEELNQLRDFSDPTEPGMVIHLKDLNFLHTGQSRQCGAVPVSRVVSAVGSRPSVMPCMDLSLVADLSPIVNEGDDGQAAVGLATSDFDVIVCGAQAVSIGAAMGLGQQFNAVGDRTGQPGPGLVPMRFNIRSIMRHQERIQMGGRVDEMACMRSLFVDEALDPYSADHAEVSHFLQNNGVHKKAAEEMAVVVLEKRAGQIKKGGEFGSAEMTDVLTEVWKE
jgi:hypothetical protein